MSYRDPWSTNPHPISLWWPQNIAESKHAGNGHELLFWHTELLGPHCAKYLLEVPLTSGPALARVDLTKKHEKMVVTSYSRKDRL